MKRPARAGILAAALLVAGCARSEKSGADTAMAFSSPAKENDTSSVQSTVSAGKDSVLGRDSVIRFPIRRLPTASSSPVKR
jgi:hypothetical protein